MHSPNNPNSAANSTAGSAEASADPSATPTAGSAVTTRLFDELADLPRAERHHRLENQTLDPDTRSELESLLAAHDDAGDFLSDPSRRNDDLEPSLAGTRIGHYELLEQIGEGGFARVFRASQSHPVRREVALKIIKVGMDTRALVARFQQERQALAMMDHPNIAAIHDAGATSPASGYPGRPFFVMELVRGLRIDRYCSEASLDVRQRIDLFVDVCRAVHHAHTKGVLHRDLKPSNILVTLVDDRPVVKIIDFGIAKALGDDPRLADATMHTGAQQLLGTPQYMSPEQAVSGGADVDTRSDIYSLGAVLYELLTGAATLDEPDRAPMALSQFEQLRRLTSDREIPRPSVRVTDRTRRRELRGELDWITGKCLEKDRARRYESAAALADDLEAYLQRRPIDAAPPTLAYRARTFARRNTTAVLLSGVLVISILAGAIFSAVQAVRATRAEKLAQKRLSESQAANANLVAVNDFLSNDMIGSADPAVARGKEMSVRAALDNAAQALPTKFRDQPLTEAAVRVSVAWAYHQLGRDDLALPHSQRALELRARHLGTDHLDTITALAAHGNILKSRGHLAEAEPVLKEAWERSRRVNGEDHVATINALDAYANVLTSSGRVAEAEPLARRALEHARRALGESDFKTVAASSNYARVLYQMGRYADAEPLLRTAMQRTASAWGEDHPESLSVAMNYAMTLKQLGRLDDAEPLFHKVLELRRRVLGDDHPMTIATRDGYAGLLYAMRRFDESAALYKQAMERSAQTQGPDHPATITAMNNYGVVLQSAGRPAEADAILKEVLERRRRVQGEDHPDTLTALNNYARNMQLLGRAAEAEPLMRQALQERRRVQGDDHPNTLMSLHNYGELLRVLGRADEAEPIFEELYRRAQEAQISPATAALHMANYGPLLAQLGKYREAEAPLREAYRRMNQTGQGSDTRARPVVAALLELCEHTGGSEEATRWRAELQSLQPSSNPTSRPDSVTTRPVH